MAIQTTYTAVSPVYIHGMLAANEEAQQKIGRIAQGLVPVGYLCAPGTNAFTGPALNTLALNGASPGQIRSLPAGITDDPMLSKQWLGIPIYDSVHAPYDVTLGYSCYDNQSTVPVLLRGSMYVNVESGSAPTDQGYVYVRVAASGANTILGSYASAPGTGLVRNAALRFTSGLIQGTGAIIYANL